MDERFSDEKPERALPRSRPWPWVIALLLAAAAGFAGWRYYQMHRARAAPPFENADAGVAPDAGPLDSGTAAAPEEGDALLQSLLAQISSAPEWATWIKQGLIRRTAAAVDRVADGDSPAPVLPFMAPTDDFKVVTRNEKKYTHPDAYARYDRVTKVIASIDAAAAVRAYEKLKPFLNSAYREVGPPNRTFDGALRAAIDQLLAVPSVAGDAELVPSGLAYAYADPALEARSALAKQLMRLGPANMAVAQSKLRELKQALGAPR